MRVKEFIKGEFSGWGKYERIIFPMEILLIIFISLSIGDNKIALVSAVCGISYTILAGKGKISCYIFGLCGTFCYSYLAYKNALFGNLLLYMLYYFPMQIIGIFKWKKHMKETSHEIIKTSLPQKQKYVYFILTLLVAFAVSQVLRLSGGQAPYMDAFTTVFSVLGLLLTIKRAVEQWCVWTFVNGLSAVMWIEAYINGSNCFATILMWVTYFILGLYFLYSWKKEMNEDSR